MKYNNIDYIQKNPATKEEIITRLQNAAKKDEEYHMDDVLIDAINEYPEPFELVEPILEIIGTHPRVDFGMPGDLVHFLEQFYKYGYEELLVSSVRKLDNRNQVKI